MKSLINIKIGGEAGEGIKSVGLILSKTLMRAGFYTFDYTEYPSLIRGGHNAYQVHAGFQKVYSQVRQVDLLVALNKETVDFHQPELINDSLVIYDPDKFKLENQKTLTGHYLTTPLIKLATQDGGLPVMANNAALGAVMFLLDIDLEILKGVIGEIFTAKGETVIKQNQEAVQRGFSYAKEKFNQLKIALNQPKNENKILLSGNEAVALGAVSAGMKFFSAYPMTPTSGILHYLAAKAKDSQLVVKHAEDEISVINLALGASFAGVRSMVATSGGGFCLMTEALSMAGMMELPLVIVEGMRTGPSSGMPTWHDQSDLKFVINAGHGEFPRLVLTPGDIEECFSLTQKAFYFSEKYQLPVIILIDKYLAESLSTIRTPTSSWQNQRFSLSRQPVAENFKRYLTTAEGISERSLPGWSGGEYLSNSYEHDEWGFATESVSERKNMVEKRLKKFMALNQEIAGLKQFLAGSPPAEIGILSWGSNKGPILTALEILKNEGLPVSFLNLNLVWPLPKKQIIDFFTAKKLIIDIECNATGQLATLIREQTGVEIKNKLLKYDGRPFYPEEIIQYINKISNA